MPLIPLPQLLGRGMSVFLGSLLVVILVVGLSVGTLWGAHFIERERESLAESIGMSEKEGLELKEEFLKLQGRAQTAGADPGVKEELEADLARIEDHLTFVRKMRERLRSVGRVDLSRRRGRLALGAMLITVLIAAGFSDPYAAALFVCAQSLWVVGALGRIGRRTAAIGYVSLFWLGALVSAYYYPQRLPTAVITTSAVTQTRGSLLAETSDGVYLIEGQRRVITFVPLHDVKSMEARSAKRTRPPWLAVVIWRAIT